jgi:hypothetical protein
MTLSLPTACVLSKPAGLVRMSGKRKCGGKAHDLHQTQIAAEVATPVILCKIVIFRGLRFCIVLSRYIIPYRIMSKALPESC